ncbi:Protein FMC1-like protein [Aphelenchoides fujianensis]|nr:Protein FMC1-like protein [Aphelenchoides fujianensis]
MNAAVERSRTAVPLLRRIVHELKLANSKTALESRQVRFVLDAFRHHRLTQRLHCKAPTEAEHLAATYAAYLQSTRRLLALQEKHRGRPKSVEESARLVGLQVPAARMDEELADRYQHLLQPLRDVEKNWDGNIREYLNDYLDKLKGDRERQTVGEDGDEIKFNFSEAAMLLQGSLYIYSRKVDTLHSAVAELFAHGPAKGKKKKAGAVDQPEDPQELLGANEFALLDEKAAMLRHQVDTRWLLEQDAKREKRPLPKQGCTRAEGRRDRLVALPISFIPTKSAPASAHSLQYVQNEQRVWINQASLFAFNTHALTARKASMLAVFLNPAYVELWDRFSAAFIPFLRGEDGRRCRRIGAPYNLEVPADVYERLCAYDQGAARPDDSFLEANGRPLQSGRPLQPACTSFCDDGGGGESPVHEPPAAEGEVEAARESNGVELAPPRDSEAPAAAESFREPAPPDLSAASAFSRFSVAVPPNVERELAFLDEYALAPNGRLRHVPREGERRRPTFRRARRQLEARDALIRKKMDAAGLDFEAERLDIAAFLSAKLFSRKISRIGSVLENFSPAVRSPHMRALNEAFYEQERYERSVLKRRAEAERERRAAERRSLRAVDTNARRSRSLRRRSDSPPEAGGKRARRSASPADDFGVPVDEDEEEAEAAVEERVADYDPVGRMVRAVDEAAGGAEDEEEDAHSEVSIFPEAPPDAADEPFARGDASASFLFGEETAETRGLSRFLSNDRQFFEFTELEKFFRRVSLESLGTDGAFMRQLQSFWNADADHSQEGMKKRLQTWTRHIVEQIKQDADHAPFEIHAYGRAVLRAFGEPPDALGRVIKFRRIVAGKDRYELSRFLLAVLILANCGNVEILDRGGEAARFRGLVHSRTKLRLLSLEERHKVFESEQALLTRS